MCEVKYEVKTYEIDMKCDECGRGYMRPIGNIVFTSHPIQYPHQCTKCNHMQNYTKSYPYQFFEKV